MLLFLVWLVDNMAKRVLGGPDVFSDQIHGFSHRFFILVLVFFFGLLDAAFVPEGSADGNRCIGVTQNRIFACRFRLFFIAAIDSTFP
jgi:hypothetical protein